MLVDVSVSVQMRIIEYRYVIKFLNFKCNAATQIKAQKDTVYEDSVP